MSTVKVNELSTWTGSDISIETGKTVAGTASQFKMTGGTSGQYVQTDGSGGLSFATVAVTGLNSVQVFTSSGTWTRPTGITKVIVEVQGGGGGGSRHTGTSCVGGSAGGYAKKFIDVSSVTQAVITIGAGGAGAATSGLGVDGGDSSWVDTASGGSSTVTGVKGVSVYAVYGTSIGGLGTGGDINIQGGYGSNYSYRTGGTSQFGIGGWNGWVSETVTGAGGGYGSGGGGAYNTAAAAGASGIIVVTEYK
jgi:hypothetical protein